MTALEELKFKRNTSVVVVCTLGLAAVFDSKIRPAWISHIFTGTLFGKGALGFIIKVILYAILGIAAAAIMFIIHSFKSIYYSVEVLKSAP